MSWYTWPFFHHAAITCLDSFIACTICTTVPIDVSQINMLYVFVDIAIDLDHFVQSVLANFKSSDRLVLAGTIQFATAMQAAYKQLKSHYPVLLMPQAKPLSRGEVLGCTSPKFEAHDALM
jgi:2-(3-amino-3-carboxypropyl)histidine synthase